MKYGAVIVAAGMSTRMGQLKQLMEIDHMTFAERVVSTFRNAGVNDIAMVTGHRAEEVERSLAGSNVTFVRNERYAETQMFESAKLGLSFMADRCDKVFFCPVDTPMFLTETVRAEMEVAEQVVYPVFGNTTGHPVLIATSLIPQILRYEGSCGLKGALDSLQDASYRLLPVCDEGTAHDADTYSEYELLVDLQRRRSGYDASVGKAVAL